MVDQEETKKIYLEFEEDEEFEIEAVPGLPNGLKKVEGNYLPNYIRNLSIIKAIELRNDDTFVIGYPKSGTTWVEEIVWLINNNADIERANTVFHFERVLFLDRGIPSELIRRAPSPRVFKTHLLPQFLPENAEKKAKIIYVTRNPKDTLVSQFNFFKSSSWDKFKGTFDELVDLFIEGKLWYGPWWKHVDTYTKLENVKVIHYEDLLANPFEKIKELSVFLEKDLTNEQIGRILANTTFEHMKVSPSLDFKLLIEFEVFDDTVDFFKKGQVGQWQNFFDEAMSKRFDETIQKHLTYKEKFNYGPEIAI